MNKVGCRLHDLNSQRIITVLARTKTQLEKTTAVIDSKNQLIADQMRVIKKKDQIMQTLMTMVPAFARKEGIKKHYYNSSLI